MPENRHSKSLVADLGIEVNTLNALAPRIFQYQQSGVNQIMEKIPLEMKELRQWNRGLTLPSDPEKSRIMELNSKLQMRSCVLYLCTSKNIKHLDAFIICSVKIECTLVS